MATLFATARRSRRRTSARRHHIADQLGVPVHPGRTKPPVPTTATDRPDDAAAALPTAAPEEPTADTRHRDFDVAIESLRKHFLAVTAIVATIAVAYFPTLGWMASVWESEPDYSHGWFVLPLAITIAVSRRGTFGGLADRLSIGGFGLIVGSIAMRIAGAMLYADFLDAWSIPVLVAGVVWLFGGRRAMMWSLPAIAFLFFASPLPYRLETGLSFKLQGLATSLSPFALQSLGWPAVSQGHTIWIGDQPLNIEPACSGLRIFVGLAAAAYFFAATSDRGWGDRMMILASFVPAALIVNTGRIVITAILYDRFADAATRHMIHDYCGYAMVGGGFVVMYGMICYWRWIVRPAAATTNFTKMQN